MIANSRSELDSIRLVTLRVAHLARVAGPVVRAEAELAESSASEKGMQTVWTAYKNCSAATASPEQPGGALVPRPAQPSAWQSGKRPHLKNVPDSL
ncbi:hypothetical protein GS480_00045 [Rhodococcus hoagii]|nr:hypothetical protein [Prescottella equi]